MKLPLFVYRSLFNLWPCIRGSGARVTRISPDFRELDVKLPLNWRTRNRVGTIFGGSIYAAVDPFFMIMLMEILGRNFVVWDKGANIRFRRPGQSTLYARFRLDAAFTDALREQVLEKGEVTFDRQIDLVDEAGKVHAEVVKTLYVATKEFYRAKVKDRDGQKRNARA